MSEIYCAQLYAHIKNLKKQFSDDENPEDLLQAAIVASKVAFKMIFQLELTPNLTPELMEEVLSKAGDIPRNCFDDRRDFIIRTATKVTKEQLIAASEVNFLLTLIENKKEG